MILQKCERGQREQLQAIMGCTRLGIPWRTSAEVGNADECHVGTVEWCQEALGFAPLPNFYPDWTGNFWHRKIYPECNSWSGYNATVPWFIKPASGYKIGPPRILQPGERMPPDCVCSEVVTFLNEWRYYVADGELLAAGWYDGYREDEPAPKLDIEWPKDWCGAADFGRLVTGEIALVECHHPFACGNYLEADECEAWAMWLELGWKWTLENR